MSQANANVAHHDDDHHGLPLWGLFLAMVAFTGIEVGLYEIWKVSATEGEPFIPKLTLVLIIFVFTLPKAAIVLIWFMHLKFEKSIVISLCVLPFIFAAICIFVPLADSQTLEAHGKVNTKPADITGHGDYPGVHSASGHGGEHEKDGEHDKPESNANEDTYPY